MCQCRGQLEEHRVLIINRSFKAVATQICLMGNSLVDIYVKSWSMEDDGGA
jgi:hypothetical protein